MNKKKLSNEEIEQYNVLSDKFEHAGANEWALEEIITGIKSHEIERALVHFCFRNGPIETMHGKGQLSEEDMKTLNKFMMNRIGYILELILLEKWFELKFLINSYGTFGRNWDGSEPDDGSIRKVMLQSLKDKNPQ